MQTKTQAEEFEHCVLCGAKTVYRFDTPVEERAYYIAGAGQLCPECFKSLQKENLPFVENE